MKIKLSYIILSIGCISIGAITKIYSQVGSLDNTFDFDGRVITAVGSTDDAGHSVAIQSDGKILVAGWSYNGPFTDFALVRYNIDGSLDTTFGSDGKVTTAIGSDDDYGLSVAIQSDGKILVVGYSYIGANNDFALVRYNTDGSLDNSFDFDGKVTTTIGSTDDRGYSIAIQGDGKILVVGFSAGVSNYDFALVRYNGDGSLDTTFDFDGKVTTAIGSTSSIGYSVAIQGDSKIVVAGINSNGSDEDFALARYNTNGSLDNTFDSDGKVTTAIGSSNDIGDAVAIQSDGKILVAGFRTNAAKNDFALVRYTTNGSLDTSFDSDGKVTTAIGSTDDRGYSIAIQSDGKILVAGRSDGDFALARYTTNGSLDNTFDSDGKLTTDFGASDICYSAAIQSDGKILVAGYRYNGTIGYFALARYNNDLTGFEENNFTNTITIYPNPATDIITISMPEFTFINTISYSILNMLGEKLYAGIITQNYSQIDITNLAVGLYIIEIMADNKSIIKKVLKAN